MGCADEPTTASSPPVCIIFDASPLCEGQDGGTPGPDAAADGAPDAVTGSGDLPGTDADDASVDSSAEGDAAEGAAGDGGAADGGAAEGAAGDGAAADGAARDGGDGPHPAADGGPVDAHSPGPSGAPAKPRFLLISIDGLRPDAIFYARAATLLKLACEGAYSWRARTVDHSLTLPSHASMVSGVPPEVHGILHNDFQPGYLPVPTIFQAARQAGLRVVAVVGKNKLVQLMPPGSVDVFSAPTGYDDELVIDEAIVEVGRGFDLMFVHLPAVDILGHTTGWMSEAYLEQVGRTDRALKRLLDVVSIDTTVLVTSDHGGSGYIHWSGVAEDLHIPWIIRGPGIYRSRALGAAISTLDTSATIAHVLGIAFGPPAVGKAVLEPWTPPR